jgi:8-amino-7-oxononanoate synthase
MFYDNELKALKKAKRFRTRTSFDNELIDFASNDYLGLAQNRDQAQKAFLELTQYETIAPGSSQLVNGYHPIHQNFENQLTQLHHFEAALTVGSGFLANMALIEALPRKGDLLLLDEEYHASGVVAAKLCEAKVIFFKHNDIDDAKHYLETLSYKRAIIAIEGIYSMHGDICKKAFFTLADSFNALLIVDEAHSSGVVGENLLGVYEHYQIKPKENHIMMGTLGKAYGSYGAYILASTEIISFLENRAKSVIYATAPSLFDIALASQNLLFIKESAERYKKDIIQIHAIVKKELGIACKALILPIDVKSSQEALEIQQHLIKEGFLVGAIRPPTVKSAILRVILRTSQMKKLEQLLHLIKRYR